MSAKSAIQDVVIVSAARTPIGDFGGTMKNVSTVEMGVIAAKAAIERAGIEAADVQQTVYGNVIHTGPNDMYISRLCAMGAGVPKEAPALTVNRVCGSGLQAVISVAQSIALGDASIGLAGGTESMSNAGYLMTSARWGMRMGNSEIIDMMTNALEDPFGGGHMGVTAENLSEQYDISREAQDAFALESHHRAAHAIEQGYFKDQIVPVTIKSRRGDTEFSVDERVRMTAKIEDMEKLRPAFKKDGTVTAGNASGLNDGAAALILMTADEAANRGLKPMARIRSYGLAGVDPSIMGYGPVPAMKIAMHKAGLTVDDLDVIESNEAFAAQACTVTKELGLNPAKVNPNGGAVALGHPVGASGAIILTKLVYELQRTKARYGAATMCIGGGQGIALIVEGLTE